MKKILILIIMVFTAQIFSQYKKIVFYGTSLTTTGGWVQCMMGKIMENNPFVDYYNGAKGGMNSIWGKNNLRERVINVHPDIVTIEFAVNDCLGYPNPYYNGTMVSLDLSRQNAFDMIDSLQGYNPNIQIFILGMNMPLDSMIFGRNPAQVRPEWRTYYQLWEDVATEKGVGFIDITSQWAKLDQQTLWNYIPDGLHVSEQGGIYVTIPTILPVLELAIQSNYHSTPVELLSFIAKVKNGMVILTWKTATETDNSGFEIQRSVDGVSFIKIGYVDGHGSTTYLNSYTYSDKPQNAGVYYYRLKQTDYSGLFNYSDVINVSLTAPQLFSLKQNYPNPFNPSTIIAYNLPIESKVTLKVYDILGNEVSKLVDEVEAAGSYNVTFNAQNNMNHQQLSSGVYFYKLEVGKYSATKKMMLVR